MGFEAPGINTNGGVFPFGFARYGEYGSTGLLSTEQKRTGQRSVKFSTTIDEWTLIENYHEDFELDLRAGEKYVLTIWAYASTQRIMRTEFLDYPDGSVGDVGGRYQGTVQPSNTNGGENFYKYHTVPAQKWTQFTHTIVPRVTATNVRINIGSKNPGTPGVFVDDIVFSGPDIGPTTTSKTTTTKTTVTTGTSTSRSTFTDTIEQRLNSNIEELLQAVADGEKALLEMEKATEAKVTALEEAVKDLTSDNNALIKSNEDLKADFKTLEDRLKRLEGKLSSNSDNGGLVVPDIEVPAECAASACDAGVGIDATGQIAMDACCEPLVLKEGRCSVEPCVLQEKLDALIAKLFAEEE